VKSIILLLISVTVNEYITGQVELQSDIERPWYAVQLSSRGYVVSHVGEDPCRISAVDLDGRVSLSYGRRSVCDVNWPCHVIADRDDFLFVVDRYMCRVVLLSPGLELIRHVELEQRPTRLCLDDAARLLYVGHTSGDVVVVHM